VSVQKQVTSTQVEIVETLEDCLQIDCRYSPTMLENIRAGDRTRTGDIQLGKLALYQLSYARGAWAVLWAVCLSVL
jgi:hypothetical protein